MVKAPNSVHVLSNQCSLVPIRRVGKKPLATSLLSFQDLLPFLSLSLCFLALCLFGELAFPVDEPVPMLD